MLAVVKAPLIELIMNGKETDINAFVEAMRRNYDIRAVVKAAWEDAQPPAEDGEEYVDVRDTDWWREMATPGNLLAGTRLKHGLTQKQLAALCGMSHATVSAYECGKRPLSMRSAHRLAKAMGEDPSCFFDNVSKPE